MPYLQLISRLKVVIFNSYVSLPKGKSIIINPQYSILMVVSTKGEKNHSGCFFLRDTIPSRNKQIEDLGYPYFRKPPFFHDLSPVFFHDFHIILSRCGTVTDPLRDPWHSPSSSDAGDRFGHVFCLGDSATRLPMVRWFRDVSRSWEWAGCEIPGPGETVDG